MTKRISSLLTFIIIFLIFFIPLKDTDFGWHLRCGEMIVRRGQFCSINGFTTLLQNYRWYSPSHGYQTVLYATYILFGFRGISLLYGLTAASVFTAFIKTLKGNSLLYLILLILSAGFSWGVFGLGLRSQIFSVYFFAIFLILFEVAERNPKILPLTIPLMILWSNSHSGFFLGNILLILLILKTFALFLQKNIGRSTLLKTVTILTAANLATLINPYTFQIYGEALRHLETPLNTMIAEWVPPLPWQSFVILSVSTAIIALSFLFKSLDPLRVGLLITAVFLSLQARRNIPLFCLTAIFCLSEKNIQCRVSDTFKKIALPEFIAAFFLVVTGVILPSNLPQALSFDEKEYCQEALTILPCEMTEFLKTQKPGRIFNAYEWGGYLIWKLPNFKIFVDGRMPSWDTSNENELPVGWRGRGPYTIYIETLQNQPGWLEVLNAYQTDYLFIQSGTFMDILLKASPERYGFKEIRRQGFAVIYGRSEVTL